MYADLAGSTAPTIGATCQPRRTTAFPRSDHPACLLGTKAFGVAASTPGPSLGDNSITPIGDAARVDGQGGDRQPPDGG